MSDVKVLAFYLPQFHPIRENDLAWGKGFTEWSNVAKARPLFAGHYQPHIPADLGFYDLRVPEVKHQQVALAREYGIHGFCFHYYWFNGRRLLGRPMDDFIASQDLDFPFCLCWANENWSRRWDGSEDEIIVEQQHTPESDDNFIRDILPILKDPRYIRIEDAPLLLVYRMDLLSDALATSARWRKICAEEGVPNIHLAGVQSFGFSDPRPSGFDSAVEFPPHGFAGPDITDTIADGVEGFEGHIYDYRDIAQDHLAKPHPDFSWSRGVMVGWDNTPRRGVQGHVYIHATPREYEIWLRGAIEDTRRRLPPSQQLVFVNAWNEWGEGTHLEPDLEHGYEYLDATQRALRGRMHWHDALQALRGQENLPAQTLQRYLDDLEFSLLGLQRSADYFAQQNLLRETVGRDLAAVRFTELVPERLDGIPIDTAGRCFLDRVDGTEPRPGALIPRSRTVHLVGWSMVPGIPTGRDTRRYLTLFNLAEGRTYYGLLEGWDERTDVAGAFPAVAAESTRSSGFRCFAWFRDVPPGRYRIGITHVGQNFIGKNVFLMTIILA